MTDLQAHLRKIRSDAAECLMLSNLATEGKRELFARIAEHLNALALEIEKTTAVGGAADGSATVAPNHEQTVPADHERPAALELEQAAAVRRPARSWWISSALLAGVLVLVAGASLLAVDRASRTPQDDMKQAVATILSDGQADRKVLKQELGALAARMDGLERAVNNFERSHGEIETPVNKRSAGAEEKSAPAELKSSTPEERPLRTDEARASRPGKSISAEGTADPNPPRLPSAASAPTVEPVDRVGAISETKRAEAESARAAAGPPGCTHFRSFDPVSGTYTTFDGRRRPCR